MESFEELGVAPELVEALAAEGIERPTPLQEDAVPILRQGNNLVLHAGHELTDTSLVNLAEAGRTAKRQALMAQVTAEEMVVFSPEGTTKASISVFTDVDCGYCQKLHLEVPKLNEMGIEVRYLAYPRAGVGSQSYQKIVSAWCSADRNTAITRLKARQTIPTLTCSNPVASQLDLGREVGVTGTPAIVLEDGRLLPGYMPAEQLAEALGI